MIVLFEAANFDTLNFDCLKVETNAARIGSAALHYRQLSQKGKFSQREHGLHPGSTHPFFPTPSARIRYASSLGFREIEPLASDSQQLTPALNCRFAAGLVEYAGVLVNASVW